MTRFAYLLFALGVVASVCGCSGNSCDIPPGTRLSTLPVLELEYVGYATSSDGHFEMHFCCSAALALDGGCDAACPGVQQVDAYLIGPPYGGQECKGLAFPGVLQCHAYVVDGGVIASGFSCID